MSQLITSQSELDTFVASITDADILSIDIETNEKFDEEHRHGMQMTIHGIGVYTGKQSAYIIFSYSLDRKSFDEMCRKFPVVMHNAKFDLPILRRYGVITDIDKIVFHDTMIMSYVHDESKPSHGLKKLAKSILGKDEVTTFGDVDNKPQRQGAGSLFEFDDSMESAYQEDVKRWLEAFAQYCIDDCINTYELYHYFKK